MLDKRALALALLAGACSEKTAMQPPPPPPPGGVALQQVPGAFSQPLFVTAPPGDLERIFVVEQRGRIRVLRNGALLPQPFLDLSASVSTGDEQGLLGMAFHRQYATNGRFYVSFTNPAGDTRVVHYTVSTDPDLADPQSADTVLMVAHLPGSLFHNGGWIGFGPDGYLYVALGDGFSPANGQSLDSLLGKILRLDVDRGSPYAIPLDNPFVGASGRDEIWVYGVRNPWRPSFDRQTGDFYIADVGQDSSEEVNVQPAASGGGEDYGWNVMEGRQCFEPPTGCDQTGKTQPDHVYATRPNNCAITGGYVYRGTQVPALAGRYVFGDFCSGSIWSFRWSGGQVVDLRNHTDTLRAPALITSFGEDAGGELYLTTLDGGVYRFVAAAP
jgi:glucose/arabinose dehydrogenase